MTSQQLALFRGRIQKWFAQHGRSLPWRIGTAAVLSPDVPYRVWVSEIMLQQTTTKTVEGYFDRFLARFPSIASLAAAQLDEVNRLWEGLGYYRRAAQLHQAAQILAKKFDGQFPQRFEDALSLPGIGRYTAGAILSISFDARLPILEANTIRLHARLLALQTDPTQKAATERLWEFAEKILPRRKVGQFNQTLMDLGSQICTPSNPDCENCPVFAFCEAAKRGLQGHIPYRKTKPLPEERTEVAILVREKSRKSNSSGKTGKINTGKILMVQYPPGVRWAGLWDFPRCAVPSSENGEFGKNPELAKQLAAMTGRNLRVGRVIDFLKHSVTRFRISLFFCEAEDNGKSDSTAPFQTRWVSESELADLPLNSTARKLVERHLR